MWQRVPIWRITIIILVLLLSLWKLLPTFQFYSLDPLVRNSGETTELKELSEKIAGNPENVAELRKIQKKLKDDFRDLKSHSIRLGLDLQGGVHLVLLIDMPKYESMLREEGKTEDEIQYAKDTVLDSAAVVIESRVDQFGVSEASLIKQKPDRLILEMPGFSDPEEVRNLVQAEAQLFFHLVAPENEMTTILADIDAVVEDDLGSLMYTVPGMGAAVVESPDNIEIVKEILQRPELRGIVTSEYVFKWGPEQEPTRYYNFPHRRLYLLKAKEEISGANLDTAWVYINPVNNQPEVSLRFDRDGARTFQRVTGDNVGRMLAVVLDDVVYSAPRIETEISGGSANIHGINDFDEARQISVVLRAGAIDAPMEIANQRVVGPSLGADSIRKGIYGGLIGGAFVLVFMVFYYSLTGLIADIAVMMNIFLLLAGLAVFKATLTLPGIAGIVLTIGMAVDANVLIYERIREELKSKRAKGVQLVIDKAFGRAFMTIFDANLTTLITALVLFQFGTGPIKGFAVTLSLGILISMYTAVFVSRVIMDTLTAMGMQHISVGTFQFFGDTHFDFLKKSRVFMGATMLVGFVGFGYLVFDWQNLQGIDFAGGTELVAEFEEPVSVEAVRTGMGSIGMADAVIQQVLDEDNQVLIRVREGEVADASELETKVRNALPDHPFITIMADLISAKVGGELLLKGLYCLIFSSIGILLYITARFEFRFAVAAVAALFHDLLFTLGILAFTGTDFNLPIIAALLTVLGYSLNDTIVVFDRIRENYSSALLHFRDIVNQSINQTLGRTVNTSLTTLFVIFTLDLFGGAVIHDFAFTLMVGILIGTYSSIFIASPILLMMGEPPKAAAPAATGRKESGTMTASSGALGM